MRYKLRKWNNFQIKKNKTLWINVYVYMLLWSFCVVANDVMVEFCCSEVDDVLYEDEVFKSNVVLSWFFRTLRSIKSEIKAGFVIVLSSTFISPVSILTTEDMDGRHFGDSWVQRRPIFRNLHACSASNSPFRDVSTSATSSFRS